MTEIEGEYIRSWQAITEAIAEGQKHNIRHDAAEVAKGSVPFQDEDKPHTFLAAFRASLNSAEHPAGFGLDSQYQIVRVIQNWTFEIFSGDSPPL